MFFNLFQAIILLVFHTDGFATESLSGPSMCRHIAVRESQQLHQLLQRAFVRQDNSSSVSNSLSSGLSNSLSSVTLLTVDTLSVGWLAA
jgi:hypothetical protein